MQEECIEMCHLHNCVFLFPKQAGTTLQKLTSTTDAITVQSVTLLVVFAILSILPVLFKDR